MTYYGSLPFDTPAALISGNRLKAVIIRGRWRGSLNCIILHSVANLAEKSGATVYLRSFMGDPYSLHNTKSHWRQGRQKRNGNDGTDNEKYNRSGSPRSP